MNTKSFTTSAILATLLFSGCGGGTADAGLTKQPHDTSKLGRTVSVEKDWTWDVGVELKKLNSTTVIQTHFWEGIPKNLKKFQVFIDMDNDTNTGYSGSNGWEIDGADYLIENGKVFKSLSNTEWKWEYIDGFKDSLLHTNGLGKYGFFDWRASTPKIDKIFNKDGFKVMIEAYDENWEGTCSTITGISSNIVDFSTGDFSLSVIEESIRLSYDTKFTTVTTVDFAPNKQEAIVIKINKWTGKKMYLVNISNIEKSIPIALEYKNKFIYKTNIVKDNGIVEFQVKEDDGTKYQVVYDYKNKKEISKTLIEGNTVNSKKVLVKKSTDKNNDGVIDDVISYTYHNNGKLKTRNNGRSTNQYNEHGDLVKYNSDSPYSYRYTYNDTGKIEKRETLNDDGTVKSFLRYGYNSHGNKIATYKNNDEQTTWYSKYDYDANGNLLKKEHYINNAPYQDDLEFTETFKYDEQNRVIEYFADSYDSNPAHYTSSYNSAGKEVKRVDLSYNDDGVSSDKYYEYDNDGYLIVEKIDYHDFPDHLKKGDIDKVIYYEWK